VSPKVSQALQIRPLDAADPDQMAAWHATYHAAHVFGHEHATPRMLPEIRADFLVDRPGDRREGWFGYVDGEVVVTGSVSLPLMDNRTLAELDVATRPDLRRRGHGSAMLEHLVERAVAQGRDTLTSDGYWSFEEPADGAGTPSAEFLTRHGFAFALGNVQRALSLPVDDAALERLAEQAAPYHRGYRLREFCGPVPDDVIDAFGDLIGSLITEAPLGDLDLEEEVFDADRIRADEKVLESMGREKYTTVAIAPDGELVAYSEIAVSRHEPGRAHQWGTLVRPAHRGHRLGIATKAHNLRFLQQHEPARSVVYTYNADVNDHMIRVNEIFGFRPVGRLGEFQRKL